MPFLCQAQAKRRCFEKLVCKPSAGCLKLLLRDNLGNEADAQGAFRIDEAPRKHELGRDRASDQSRQQIADPDIAGGKSNFDEGRVHANGRRGDADVGGERERESAPRGGAVDQRNDRLRTTAHRQNDFGKPSLEEQDRLDVIARFAVKVLDIEPGAKCASGAGQHDHSHRFVEQQGLKIVEQLIDHSSGQAVQ